MSGEMRMSAYYYGFDKTGVPEIDLILSAVACAGKAFHYTEQWDDECGQWDEHHTGKTPVDWIQEAANKAAEKILSTRPLIQVKELEWSRPRFQPDYYKLHLESANAIGHFEIYEYSWEKIDPYFLDLYDDKLGRFKTIEQAKQAAQDYVLETVLKLIKFETADSLDQGTAKEKV